MEHVRFVDWFSNDLFRLRERMEDIYRICKQKSGVPLTEVNSDVSFSKMNGLDGVC